MENKGGFVIEQRGPGGWTVVGIGGLISVAMVIIALALWSISIYVGIALIVLSAGQAVALACGGASLVIEARARAVAMIKEIEARRSLAARGCWPGPRARADMEALWGDGDGA